MWLTTEGVFGIALGVSVQFIFLFVLFGTLLDRAGGGNYMMQVCFALLGHLRGGPAKVAVVSSALNGMISGSSVSNVVSGGIFTIPLMKKAGYGGVKAGAIETRARVNGQIMPPVMGAAAFLMVEYVGIPYSEIIKHAFLPAVHLVHRAVLHRASRGAEARHEADSARYGDRPWRERLLRLGARASSGTIVVLGADLLRASTRCAGAVRRRGAAGSSALLAPRSYVVCSGTRARARPAGRRPRRRQSHAAACRGRRCRPGCISSFRSAC